MLELGLCNISCGVRILTGETNYKTAETYFKDLAGLSYQKDGLPLNSSNYTQFLYSHAPAKTDIGNRIKEYIEKYNLGVVTVSALGNNPIHGSIICIWVWTRDNVTFREHCLSLLNPIYQKDNKCL